MLYKWEASCFSIYRDREQAEKNNGPTSKAIKPILGKVLFVNSGKIVELEIYDPYWGSPFYIVDLPSGECLLGNLRKVSGEGYDFIDMLSSKRVSKGCFC